MYGYLVGAVPLHWRLRGGTGGVRDGTWGGATIRGNRGAAARALTYALPAGTSHILGAFPILEGRSTVATRS
jgi:hypothetical protein